MQASVKLRSNQPGVYRIQNLLNNRFYIGSSRHTWTRFRSHVSLLKRGKHRNQFLQNDWNVCGEEAFEFLLIEQVDNLDELIELEQKWLDAHFDHQISCYNICNKAESTTGYKHTKTAIAKMVECKKGDKNPSKRDEVKKALSIAMSGQNNHQFGKKRPWLAEVGKQKSKRVSQYTSAGLLLGVWSSASEASRNLMIERSNINKCCRKQAKTCGGFEWRFTDEH